ncbi:MAG TPA: acyl-CoA synthetase [Pseudomonas sp.]|jgi:hypothetical protein
MPDHYRTGDAMSVYEIKRAQRDDSVPDALERLRQWANTAPLDIALCHKRHGQWHAWRWIDVVRDVEQLVDGLHQHGFDEHSRLVLSGAFDPDFLLLALAVQASGGTLVVVPAPSSAEQARRIVEVQRPTHSFVPLRRDLGLWLAAAERSSVLHTLICGQAPLIETAGATVTSVARLRLSAGNSAAARRQKQRSKGFKQLWVEEGSEWEGGFAVLLAQWLDLGQALAFAECPGSVARDRRDVTPTGLLMSAGRLRVLADEIESRLPPPGTWRRRLCDWTIADPQQGVRRLLRNRVKRLLGFGHVSFIWQAVPQSASTHPWAAPVSRNVA